MQNPKTAFKILTESQWAAWGQSSTFYGAGIDVQDGYIHLSTATQTGETYSKYFSGQDDLVVVEIDLEKVQDPVKWEVSRGGQKFPHVYGMIDLKAAGRRWTGSEIGSELFETLVKEENSSNAIGR